MDVVTLTRKLLSFNTINPPGNEAEIALFAGNLLEENGFRVSYFSFAENRLNLIAEKGLSPLKAPIVLSGHFDTVPLGAGQWSTDPFAGKMSDGKIWGRGSCDMKGGIAAMIIASVHAFAEGVPAGGIRLIFTADEETGCSGASQLASRRLLPGNASAIIVGEPTGNIPVTGHKGAIYLNAFATGITAHSSMPELGDNAIYKAAEAILKLRDIDFRTEPDPLLGLPTINVGKISGGMNINSVADNAEFTIDIRTTALSDNRKIMNILSEAAGADIRFETLVDINALCTPLSDPFILTVFNVLRINPEDKEYPKALPYLTDGAVLQKYYNAPAIVLGPGEPQMAHRTDEYVNIGNLEKAVEVYREIILNWKSNG